MLFESLLLDYAVSSNHQPLKKLKTEKNLFAFLYFEIFGELSTMHSKSGGWFTKLGDKMKLQAIFYTNKKRN